MALAKTNRVRPTSDLDPEDLPQSQTAAAKEPEVAKAKTKKASVSIKTVTLLGCSQIPDPGTGVVLNRGQATIVPEISKWVRMQAEQSPAYLTFTE